MSSASPSSPIEPPAPLTDSVTPVMAQYLEIKAANPNCLLFYRMGDFYELFFDDAVQASRALGITLTKRGKHQGQDIPMAGVPFHAADEYLHRLISAGYKVAVAEQMENPADARKRGSKAVVQRDVVRLVTPGTLTEEKLLVAGEANYLAAIISADKGSAQTRVQPQAEPLALAWIDISTGEFRVALCPPDRLYSELMRISPRELVIPAALLDDKPVRQMVQALPITLSPMEKLPPDLPQAQQLLCAYFPQAQTSEFAALSPYELKAAAFLIAYVEHTQIGAKPVLTLPQRENADAYLHIDAAARSSLELTRTLSGERVGSLLWAIDATLSAAGGRELARRLCAPCCDVQEINQRLDRVSSLVAHTALRLTLREQMARVPDMLRALSRLALERAGPRDLSMVRDGLIAAQALAQELHGIVQFDALIGVLQAPSRCIVETLSAALSDDLPLMKRDGGFVRTGFDGELDLQRRLRDESQAIILALQSQYAEETGIKGLKIRHNNVLGYFIEITQANAERLDMSALNGRFIHRQTLANQMRFTTTELAELQTQVLGAADLALSRELAIFEQLRTLICAHEPQLRAVAEVLAELDVQAGLAELAVEQGWVRPLLDNSLAFDIVGGRHPVVERALRAAGDAPFIANDCALGPQENEKFGRILLLTGPNMAGKSTFLRQNALLVLLAQMGSFVPAKSAHIGVVDHLFSRVGAADDLARGRSTFMVEMVETAAILTQATVRSLVILDEIGRGTATFDGLSIAWACVEHLHQTTCCRALFATHFHELTSLAAQLPRLHPITMKVKEWQQEVIFLHEVGAGAADRSYGIQVARLAGLPDSVIARARQVLARLEAGGRTPHLARLVDDLPLFAVSAPVIPEAYKKLAAALAALEPDVMTPRDALEALYALRKILPHLHET